MFHIFNLNFPLNVYGEAISESCSGTALYYFHPNLHDFLNISYFCLWKLTSQVTALDAFEVCIHPEQFPQLVVQSQSDWPDEAGGEQRLPLCPVQTGTFDLS